MSTIIIVCGQHCWNIGLKNMAVLKTDELFRSKGFSEQGRHSLVSFEKIHSLPYLIPSHKAINTLQITNNEQISLRITDWNPKNSKLNSRPRRINKFAKKIISLLTKNLSLTTWNVKNFTQVLLLWLIKSAKRELCAIIYQKAHLNGS